jgi:hypothetical protein
VKIDGNLQYEEEKTYKCSISNTCSMLYTLFESILNHRKFIHEIESTEDGDFPLSELRHFITNQPDGQYIQISSEEVWKEPSVKLMHSWCWFLHRQYILKYYAICLDIDNQINPVKDGAFARDLLQFVGLNENELFLESLEAFRKSQSNKLNKISTYAHRPNQHITLTEFLKQNGLMDTPGVGWDDIDKEDFFKGRSGKLKKHCSHKEMVTIDVCEQWNTLLKTSQNICKVNHPDYGIMYEIQCDTGKFDKKNSGLRHCQKQLFAEDEFVFVASDELIMSMSYEFIIKLRPDKWTN